MNSLIQTLRAFRRTLGSLEDGYCRARSQATTNKRYQISPKTSQIEAWRVPNGLPTTPKCTQKVKRGFPGAVGAPEAARLL